MWVFTESGFVSAVRHREDMSKLIVRARDAKSLEQLARLASAQIAKTPNADYPYRMVVSNEDFKLWNDLNVECLDYPNFKSHIAITRGEKYLDALSIVWIIMHEVEDEGVRL